MPGQDQEDINDKINKIFPYHSFLNFLGTDIIYSFIIVTLNDSIHLAIKKVSDIDQSQRADV